MIPNATALPGDHAAATLRASAVVDGSHAANATMQSAISETKCLRRRVYMGELCGVRVPHGKAVLMRYTSYVHGLAIAGQCQLDFNWISIGFQLDFH